jgi:hypothetical protein
VLGRISALLAKIIRTGLAEFFRLLQLAALSNPRISVSPTNMHCSLPALCSTHTRSHSSHELAGWLAGSTGGRQRQREQEHNGIPVAQYISAPSAARTLAPGHVVRRLPGNPIDLPMTCEDRDAPLYFSTPASQMAPGAGWGLRKHPLSFGWGGGVSGPTKLWIYTHTHNMHVL